MKEIHNNLYIGDDGACASCTRNSNFCIVHACKSCHKKALNYASSLPNTHPNYLTYENGEHLFLNIVDMYDELLPQFMRPIVKETLSFIESRIQHKKILIHCNFGSSRSPSLGFIYLANKGIIPNNSYESALQEFLKLYPRYMPGAGITLYMQHDWNWLCEA
jgi:protein-tyrosine phosphatase